VEAEAALLVVHRLARLCRRHPLEALAPERDLRGGAVSIELGAPGKAHQAREGWMWGQLGLERPG